MSRVDLQESANVNSGLDAGVDGARSKRRVRWFANVLRSYPVLFGMVLTVVVLEVATPELLSGGEIMSILNQIAPVAIIAMGLSVALSASALDISVAQSADMGAVAAGLLLAAGASAWETIVIVVLVGVAVGVVNGFVASWIGVSSLITTLAMTFLLQGVELILTHGGAATTLFSLSGSASVQFARLGQGSLGAVSVSLLIAIGIALLLLGLERRSILGREIRLVGQNLSAAAAIGIRVRRRFAAAFVISAVVGSLAGLMILAMTGIASPGSGSAFLVEAFAAAYLGGLAGRRPRFGTVEACVGAVYVSILATGLTLMGANAALQDVVEGGLLIVAIGLNRMRAYG